MTCFSVPQIIMCIELWWWLVFQCASDHHVYWGLMMTCVSVCLRSSCVLRSDDDLCFSVPQIIMCIELWWWLVFQCASDHHVYWGLMMTCCVSVCHRSSCVLSSDDDLCFSVPQIIMCIEVWWWLVSVCLRSSCVLSSDDDLCFSVPQIIMCIELWWWLVSVCLRSSCVLSSDGGQQGS